MNEAFCRGAWDKCCTDIMYITIEYPNYPILTQSRTCCDLEIQVSTSGLELECSPSQPSVLPLSYDAPLEVNNSCTCCLYVRFTKLNL